jgi:RNA polymerase-binding transcription factor DksA
MVVKKATSAANKSARPKKAASTKPAPTKVTATGMTGMTAKAATKASETKPTTKTASKTAKATNATVKASATKVTAAKATPKTRTTKVTAAKTAPKTSEGRRGGGVSTRASAQPQRLRVRESEKPWTLKELATVHSELESDLARLQKEIIAAEFDLAGLMRDVGDGAGDDPADAGTATFEREQEISLANNAREVFEQSARALARLVAGTYGVCESCGNPIGKNRLLAFPRATLCMTCKSKQERR